MIARRPPLYRYTCVCCMRWWNRQSHGNVGASLLGEPLWNRKQGWAQRHSRSLSGHGTGIPPSISSFENCLMQFLTANRRSGIRLKILPRIDYFESLLKLNSIRVFESVLTFRISISCNWYSPCTFSNSFGSNLLTTLPLAS